MKRSILIIMAVAFLGLTAHAQKQVSLKNYLISWKGYKVGGSHMGDIKIKEGGVIVNANNDISGGKLVLDMNSIETTDMDVENNTKLTNHLKSKDFFDVKNHPTATLVFKEITKQGDNVYNIKGDLTIKGITKPINFAIKQSGSSYSTKITIDRTLYGIKYGSGSFFDDLGNRAISDEFDIEASFRM